MKLRGVEISETVSRFLYCIGFAEVTWKSFSVVSLIFSRIRHVGPDVNQSSDRRIRPGFSNYGSAIAVSDKNARSILLRKDTLRRGHIIFTGCLRLLDHADRVTIPNQNVVNTFPARTICPGAMNPKSIPNAMRFALR